MKLEILLFLTPHLLQTLTQMHPYVALKVRSKMLFLLCSMFGRLLDSWGRFPKVGSLAGNISENPKCRKIPVQMTLIVSNLSIVTSVLALGRVAAHLPF